MLGVDGGSEVVKAEALTTTATLTSNFEESIRSVRWLRFSNALRATLIPSRRDYIDEGIFYDIYISENEFIDMKKNAIDEIRAYMVKHNVTQRQATTALFQPNQEAEDEMDTGLYSVAPQRFDGANSVTVCSQMLNFLTDDCLFDSVLETSLEKRNRGIYVDDEKMVQTSVVRDIMLSTDAHDEMQLLSFRGYITSEV